MLENNYPKYPRRAKISPALLQLITIWVGIAIALAISSAVIYFLWNIIVEPYSALRLTYKQSFAIVVLLHFLKFI